MSPWLLRIELNREMMVRACEIVSVLPLCAPLAAFATLGHSRLLVI